MYKRTLWSNGNEQETQVTGRVALADVTTTATLSEIMQSNKNNLLRGLARHSFSALCKHMW